MTGPGIPVQIGEREAQGVYANLALITHSSSEFVLDFAKMLPGLQRAIVQARVVMTPQHAKMFARALQENLSKFEEKYGTIRIPDQGELHREIGFKPPEVVPETKEP